MADTTQPPINGTYTAPHPYPDPYVSHAPVNTVNNTMGNNYHPATSTPSNGPAGSEPKNEIPKDEVGWYFVEQYYTTMSRNPDRLHLFYSRHSHFVFGTEAESVPVAVGQKAINEKIRALDFHDCKVRVLNVDTQGSMDNILVAVIGEISNRSEPSRKFSQTFVLAQQPNGYYVLNDIFRYLADEVEEFVVDETAAAQPESVSELQDTSVAQQETTSEPEQPSAAQETDEDAISEVDAKLAAVTINGEVDKAPQAVAQEKAAVPVTPAVPAVPTEPEALQPEKPQTPEPSPAASTPKESAPAVKKEPVVPTKAVPMSWANVASKNRAAAAAAAAATAAAPTAPAKSAAAAATAAAAPAPSAVPAQPQPEQPAATVPAEASTSSQQSSTDGSGWQTAGHDHGKKQSRAGDDHKHPAYIKNVNEKVDASLLKTVLSRFGKLTHFDVNRSRSCAFVDFADQASYNAAVAANPHQIGSEQVTVEERRVRTGNFSNGFANGRGGANRGRSDGRAGSQGRGGNYQREQGRGGFSSRGGRGGNVNKGRSQAQAA